MEAHRRDLRAGAHRRGPRGKRRAGGGADAPRTGHAGRVRPLLPAAASSPGTPSPWRRPARSATRRTRPASWRCARERTNLPIRVLSREEEARYGYLAAVNSTTLTDGGVLDLGGGSLQLVRVVDRLARELGSWRLGAVRMTERFLPGNGPAKRRQIEQLREHVAAELARAEWLDARGPAPGRHRRHRPQPGRRRPASVGYALQRGAGDRRFERGAGGPRGASSRRCLPRSAARSRASSPRAPT